MYLVCKPMVCITFFVVTYNCLAFLGFSFEKIYIIKTDTKCDYLTFYNKQVLSNMQKFPKGEIMRCELCHYVKF